MLWAQIIEKILGRLGGFGSDMVQAGTIYNDADKARQAELKRRQELGQLGLTDEEVGNMRERTVAPTQSAMREQNLRGLSDTSIQDVGSGAYFADRAAATDRYNRQITAAGQGIAEAQESARQMQEKELLDLAQKKEDKRAAQWQAVFQNLVADDEGNMTSIADAYGSNAAAGEEEAAISSQGTGTEAADMEDVSGIMEQFGGMGG